MLFDDQGMVMTKFQELEDKLQGVSKHIVSTNQIIAIRSREIEQSLRHTIESDIVEKLKIVVMSNFESLSRSSLEPLSRINTLEDRINRINSNISRVFHTIQSSNEDLKAKQTIHQQLQEQNDSFKIKMKKILERCKALTESDVRLLFSCLI